MSARPSTCARGAGLEVVVGVTIVAVLIERMPVTEGLAQFGFQRGFGRRSPRPAVAWRTSSAPRVSPAPALWRLWLHATLWQDRPAPNMPPRRAGALHPLG